MKTCPICKARCFDDMELCYGCMHRFESSGDDAPVPIGDTVGIDELPLRPAALRDASSARPRKEARRDSHREARHVFGAVDEDVPLYNHAPGDASSRIRKPAHGAGEVPLRLELSEGPVASASLGNGYRLVVSVERET
jgi:hypothetical protein